MASLPRTESAFIDQAFDYLRARGAECHLGVPCLSRCIDMVVLMEEEVIAIEFKLRDWKRAIAQATDHLLAADRAYICLPVRPVPPAMVEILHRARVGLMLSNPSEDSPLQVVIPAPSSAVKWPVAERWLIQALEQRRTEVDRPVKHGEVALS